MGGTITRDEWLKLQEGERERAMAPRGPGNVVIPLALEMTKEERLGKEPSARPSSGADASQAESDSR